MAKFFHFKLASIFLTGILLSSCSSKKGNLEINLSDFKVPNKSSAKISNLESNKPTKINNELINYQTKEEILGSVLLGKKDPFSEQLLILD